MIAIFVDIGISQVFKSRIFDNYTVQFLSGYSMNQTPHIDLIDSMPLYVGNEVIIHHHHKDHHHHHHHYHKDHNHHHHHYRYSINHSTID